MSQTSISLYVNNVKPYFSKHLNKFLRLVEPDFIGEIRLREIEHTLSSPMAKKNVNPLNLEGKELK